MLTYETQELTDMEAVRFGIWFDKKVGTERETTDHGHFKTISCFELEMDEVSLCREIEGAVKDDSSFGIPESFENDHL